MKIVTIQASTWCRGATFPILAGHGGEVSDAYNCEVIVVDINPERVLLLRDVYLALHQKTLHQYMNAMVYYHPFQAFSCYSVDDQTDTVLQELYDGGTRIAPADDWLPTGCEERRIECCEMEIERVGVSFAFLSKYHEARMATAQISYEELKPCTQPTTSKRRKP